jgi:hypothetical protein
VTGQQQRVGQAPRIAPPILDGPGDGGVISDRPDPGQQGGELVGIVLDLDLLADSRAAAVNSHRDVDMLVRIDSYCHHRADSPQRPPGTGHRQQHRPGDKPIAS